MSEHLFRVIDFIQKNGFKVNAISVNDIVYESQHSKYKISLPKDVDRSSERHFIANGTILHPKKVCVNSKTGQLAKDFDLTLKFHD
jgi:hypothetical protein